MEPQGEGRGGSAVKELLKLGDPCPFCGQPIKTDDPESLMLLNWVAWLQADKTKEAKP